MTDPLPPERSHPEPRSDEKQFHGWRLVGCILLVMVAIAIVAAVVDWWVIGPLEGRAPGFK